MLVNLRHNWPLLVAIGLFLLCMGILGVQISQRARLDAPKLGEPIYYWSRVNSPILDDVVRNFICVWPNIVIFSFVVFIVQQIGSFIENKRLSYVFLILANFIGVVIFFLSLTQPDGHRLIHIESISTLSKMYHLTFDNVQGGGSDYFYSEYFVFKCDKSGNSCSAIYNKINPNGFSTNPVKATLTIDPDTNTLYLQIGDEKTLIAE